MQRSMLLSELRVRVTGASVDYVGSVTIHQDVCDALGLLERQMVHICNEQSGVDLWTYVIRGQDATVPTGTVCLNGAAAHLVQVGDIVTITARGWISDGGSEECLVTPRTYNAIDHGFEGVMNTMGLPPTNWAQNILLEYACGKVHRPRVTQVVTDRAFPAIYIAQDWAQEAGLLNGEAVHVVNVTNGQRDILTLRYAPSGSKECAVHMRQPAAFGGSKGGYGSRAGYQQGDVVIAMNYGYLPRGTILQGKAPPMKICFPFETPKTVNLRDLWEESATTPTNPQESVAVLDE